MVLFCALLGLAACGQPQAQPLTITGDQLWELMKPLLSVSGDDRRKIVARMVERRRLVIPTPALLLSFSTNAPAESCLTAALPAAEWRLDDHRCLSVDGAPSLADLEPAIRTQLPPGEGPTFVLLSPLLDRERVELMFPDRASEFEVVFQAYTEVRDEIRRSNPSATVVEVAVWL